MDVKKLSIKSKNMGFQHFHDIIYSISNVIKLFIVGVLPSVMEEIRILAFLDVLDNSKLIFVFPCKMVCIFKLMASECWDCPDELVQSLSISDDIHSV